MRIKTDFPRPVREIKNAWIPLSDGTRLAASVWLPEDARERPVPAILEYIPYRKSDATAPRDARNHPYFAGHGYASVRVDIRGSGNSEGILYDEYLPQEQLDALEVLRWIAGQPWCTGDVGMIGISWGGFNGLQVAAHRPPELKAVITVCSTDDRYADDVHYMGGCVIGSEMLPWASNMLVRNARPPDPSHVGDRWRAIWLDRMERTPPYVDTWLAHQRRDDYWKQGSVCEDFSNIQCPVYAVGGWADAYTNAIFRLLDGLSVPCKGLIGPWAHAYPHIAVPGPTIDFLTECLRWWDHWLKGIDTGIMDEPPLRAWIQDGVPPQSYYERRPGRWARTSGWPVPDQPTRRYGLSAASGLNPEGADNNDTGGSVRLTVASPQTTGLEAGTWCAYGKPAEQPPDQRPEDGRSLCFTSAPLSEPMEILGFPEARLVLSADRPLALAAVRVCDVAPSGASTLITRGLLNLTHRVSHEHPQPLEPHTPYEVTIPLNAIGYAVPAGHRLRLSVSSSYWPLAWPAPAPVTLTLRPEASELVVPTWSPAMDVDDVEPPFAPPESAEPLTTEPLRHGAINRYVEQDRARGTTRYVVQDDFGRKRLDEQELEIETVQRDVYTIGDDDPLSATVECERSLSLARDDWRIRVETRSVMSGDAEQFHLTNVLDAYEDGVRVFAKTWDTSVPRDQV